MNIPHRVGVTLIALACVTYATAPAHAGMTPPTNADRSFVRAASASNKAEVDAAEVALRKGDASTKTFARTMIRDHTRLQKSLLRAASSVKVSVTPTPTVAQAKALAALTKLSGSTFDHTYLQEQVSAHKATLAVLKKEASSGGNSLLMHAAKAAMPIVQMHLSMAIKLAAAAS